MLVFYPGAAGAGRRVLTNRILRSANTGKCKNDEWKKCGVEFSHINVFLSNYEYAFVVCMRNLPAIISNQLTYFSPDFIKNNNLLLCIPLQTMVSKIRNYI